ncbi:hypothetical protein PENARI_c003G02864 [Penicillium arizonense]|uniref:Uncharacterized protein n=1 Tax=Penicillium arizonense TaxID=1835702 RepID=A0A1F5LSB2_PENAI|nr:hypothetical protein PENARI_c003G02864 [Penicillium arizonense]OGE56098.1 hypothetical protein PENARI_c003G02864 [Penicillium arizonense]
MWVMWSCDLLSGGSWALNSWSSSWVFSWASPLVDPSWALLLVGVTIYL